MGGKASFFVALVEVFFRWSNVEMRVRVGDEGERSGEVQQHGRRERAVPSAGGGCGSRPRRGLIDGLSRRWPGDLTKADFVRNVGKIYRGTHPRT